MSIAAELTTLLRSVSPLVWEAAMAALVEANKLAKVDSSSLAAPVKRDAFGHYERARFETLLEAALKSMNGVSCEFKQNDAGTANYLKIRLGEKLVLTQSSVPSRSALPRKADYRCNLSRQIKMFEPNDEPDTIYAILVHTNDKNLDVTHASVVVPDSKCERVLARLPLDEMLLAALPDPIDSEAKADREDIAEPQIKLRPAARKADKKSGT